MIRKAYCLNAAIIAAITGVYVNDAHAQASATLQVVESTPGMWEVFVSITGDTSGLYAYHLNVVDTDPTLISYEENTLIVLSSLNPVFFTGFVKHIQGIVGDDLFFNAGSNQGPAQGDPIFNVGITPVFVPGILGPPVDLDVPAKLGTFITPTGLGANNFELDGFGAVLFDDSMTPGNFLESNEVMVTLEVVPFPEPSTVALFALTAPALLLRRRQDAPAAPCRDFGF